MTISYPLSLPTGIPGFNSLVIQPDVSVGIATSRFNYKQQIYQYEGQRWTASAQYPPLKLEQAGKVQAFLLSLNGAVGTFIMGDYLRSSPTGAVSGTVLVKNGGQTGQTLVVDGLPGGLPGAFLAGDQIQIGNHLYTILADANANGSGECTLDIWPYLRSSPADNAVVTYVNPKGIWRIDGVMGGWSANEVGMYDISFSAVEAL